MLRPVLLCCVAFVDCRQAQWVEVQGLASGMTLADILTLDSGRVVWEGAGEWKAFACPVQHALSATKDAKVRVPSAMYGDVS